MPRSFVALLVGAAFLAVPSLRAEAQGRGQIATDTGCVADSASRADSLARRAAAREIAGMRVVGARARRASYATTASRTATKTDTPHRDTPQ